MCGIAGFNGNNAVIASMLITLGQLERGTKGTGLAYICNKRIRIMKEPCHPIDFVDKNLSKFHLNVNIAIAHNRLPSQGNVSWVNTHPFLSCNKSFALVHNGNCSVDDLRNELLALGHRIEGQTDSEVICHLIEELYKDTGDYAKALEELDNYGFNGALLILTEEGEIYGVRSYYSSLIIAVSHDEIAMASTKKAISNIFHKVDRWIEPKPYQVIRIANRKYELIGKGKEIKALEIDFDFDGWNWIKNWFKF